MNQGDQVILSMDERGEVRLLKGVANWKDLAGVGKKTFESLGGGDHFLKEERKMWDA